MSELAERRAVILDDYAAIPPHDESWTPPEMFKLDGTDAQSRVEELLRDGVVRRIHDPIDILSSALCEYEHPETKGDVAKQRDYIEDIKDQGEAFGTWVYFRWSGVLARYPDKADHQALRTSRNRNLITYDQQVDLLSKRVACLGLSVGSKALAALLESGIGGSYILADGDYLDPTNVNRIDASYIDVGSPKIDIVAKKISEKDPWIEQSHLRDGYKTSDEGVLGEADVIVEEVDSLQAKAQARIVAAKHKIPLVMAADIGDKSVIDVERYDLDSDPKLMFQGKLSRQEVERISRTALTPAENTGLMLKHVGVRHLSTAMIRSALAIGTELGGLPQLGMTATRGGASVAFAAREILLGHQLDSGRYAETPRETFKLPAREVPLREGLQTFMALVKHARGLKNQKA